MGGPRQGAPAALSIVFTLLARHWVAGMGWVSARHWQDLEGKPALWEVCEGVDSWGASLHALAFSGQEEGMALHFNLRSKRGAPLLPPGLQQQCDCCQAWLARPANERAQRAQQLPAARAGTPEQCSSVGAVGVSGPLALITQIIMGQGARDDQAGEGAGEALERRQRLCVGYLPLQTRRRAEMERVKFELLRTGSMGTVRCCCRGLISAWGILASLRGTRGACGCSQSAATLPSLTHTNTHAIKPADFQSVLLVQVTCPGLLIKITTLPLQNQPAQRSINKHQQEPRQNHRVNQNPIPTPPLQQIMCAGEWTHGLIGANGPAGKHSHKTCRL